jgi:hypothetical protein
VFVGEPGQHAHGHAGFGPAQLAQRVEPAHVRQAEVEQDAVHLVEVGQRLGHRRGGAQDHRRVRLVEQLADQERVARVVLDQKYPQPLATDAGPRDRAPRLLGGVRVHPPVGRPAGTPGRTPLRRVDRLRRVDPERFVDRVRFVDPLRRVDRFRLVERVRPGGRAHRPGGRRGLLGRTGRCRRQLRPDHQAVSRCSAGGTVSWASMRQSSLAGPAWSLRTRSCRTGRRRQVHCGGRPGGMHPCRSK